MNYSFTMAFAAASLLVGGCATAPKQQPSSFNVDLGENRLYTYQRYDASGREVNVSEVVSSVVDSYYESSDILKVAHYNSGSPIIKYVKGLDIQTEEGLLSASYVKGEYTPSNGQTAAIKQSADFPVAIKKSKSLLYFEITPPDTVAVSVPGQISGNRYLAELLGDTPTLISNGKVKSDLARMFSSPSPVLKRKKIDSGSFNSPYDDATVFANYQRKLGEYREDDKERNNVKKDGRFSVRVDGTWESVNIAVYPYRGGAKVEYRFDTPYELRADGSTTYNKERAKKVISKIEAIANS